MTSPLDRRQFLGGVSLTLGGSALGSWLPVSLLEAAPVACHADACGDWQLDDICIAYPPYSMQMSSPTPQAAANVVVDPVDSHWVA
jgi:hypothetical protein